MCISYDESFYLYQFSTVYTEKQTLRFRNSAGSLVIFQLMSHMVGLLKHLKRFAHCLFTEPRVCLLEYNNKTTHMIHVSAMQRRIDGRKK